jgi:hypothetical protein
MAAARCQRRCTQTGTDCVGAPDPPGADQTYWPANHEAAGQPTGAGSGDTSEDRIEAAAVEAYQAR